jgi:hypothetical protein
MPFLARVFRFYSPVLGMMLYEGKTAVNLGKSFAGVSIKKFSYEFIFPVELLDFCILFSV